MPRMNKRKKDKEVVELKTYQKKAKRMRRSRRIVLFFFLIICLVGFALFAPFFRVTNVVCEGNQQLSAEQLISASQITVGYNIYRTSLTKAVKNISTLPYVRKAEAKRQFPNKIVVMVEEWPVVAYLPFGEEYVYLNEQGTVLEQSEVAPLFPACLVEQAEPSECIPGKPFVSAKEGAFDAVVSVLQQTVQHDLLGTVTKIDVAAPNNVTVVFDEQLNVLVGDMQKLDYKLGFLARQAYNSLGEGTKGFLDVSSGTKAFYREKESKAKQQGAAQPLESPIPVPSASAPAALPQ